MASFNLSPSVDWEEQDYSLAATSEVDTIGGMAGTFTWGPAGVPVLITNGEDGLVEKFGKPTNEVWMSFMVLKDFFRYSKKAHVVRAVGASALNSTPVGTSPILVKNDDDFETNMTAQAMPLLGKYPGSLANGLGISLSPAGAYNSWDYTNLFDYAPDADRRNAVLVNTNVGRRRVQYISVYRGAIGSGSYTLTLTIDGVEHTQEFILSTDGTGIDPDESLQLRTQIVTFLNTLDDVYGFTVTPMAQPATNGTAYFIKIENNDVGTHNEMIISHTAPAAWEVAHYTDVADKTYNEGVDATQLQADEGYFGDVLELYENVHLTDGTAVDGDGNTSYLPRVVDSQSDLVRVGENAVFDKDQYILAGGVDDNGTTQAPLEMVDEIDELADSEALDVNFVISGGVSTTIQKRYSDLASARRDCIAFHSPPRSAVVGNKRNERSDILTWRNVDFNMVSSYDFIDDNWGTLYDQYNGKWRWIPLCGGTAGLTARTWSRNDPWQSPAFHNRGQYKSYGKTAWSARKGDRDELYKSSVNSAINKAGDGLLLYGDKTGLTKKSAFSRINVRSLFIVLEKSIASMSRFYLGEINDTFTQTQFLNTVRPYLRSIQRRRGMEDYRVVCDERNNDGQAKANNEFHAAFFIKPPYSINFIKLVFAAVRHDISFEEVENASGIA